MDSKTLNIFVLFIFSLTLSIFSVIVAICVSRHYFFKIGDLGGYFYLIATFIFSIVTIILVLLFTPGKTTNFIKLFIITIFIIVINLFCHNYTLNKKMIGGWYVISENFDSSKVKGNILFKVLTESDSYDKIIFDIKVNYPKNKENIYYIINKIKQDNPYYYHSTKLTIDLLLILSINHDNYAIPLWEEIIKETKDSKIKETAINALNQYYNIYLMH